MTTRFANPEWIAAQSSGKLEQFYRYDHVSKGNVTLTIENGQAGVIEVKTGKVRDMYKYRQLHYPNAHNYRHHFTGEDGCPTCER